VRKPVVDYRTFRFSKRNEPQFKHLQFLYGWIGYFALYFITEALIPAEKCFPVHSVLDDMIPFCEYFVVFYVGWYFLIAGSLLYFMLYNPENFKNMMKYIIVTQVVAMFIYIVFPNRQDLRPDVFPRENVFTWIVSLLYSLDTNTNVCPSLHVAYSLAIASAWLRERSANWLTKTLIVLFCFFVCLSVAFVKQHSVIDIFAAVPVCILAEGITYGRGYYKLFARRKAKQEA